jgi:hypothetical protein
MAQTGALFPDIQYFTATIQSGQSLSNAVSLGKWSLVGIVMPSAWTAASLSFQASPDGTNFYELYYLSGLAATNYVITSPAASQFIQLDPTQWRGLDLLKVRSGTSGAPVTQGSTAAITLVCRGVS